MSGVLPSPPSPPCSPDRGGAAKSTAIQWACAVLHNPTDPCFPPRHRKSGRPALSKCRAGAETIPAVEQEPAGETLRGSSTGGEGGGFMRIVAHCAEQEKDQRHAPPRLRQWPPATRRTGGTSPTGRQAVRARRQQQTKQGHKQPAKDFPRTRKTSPALCYDLFAPGCRVMRRGGRRPPCQTIPQLPVHVGNGLFL